MRHIPHKTIISEGKPFIAFPLEEFEDFMIVKDTKSSYEAYLKGEEEYLNQVEMNALLDSVTPLYFWRMRRSFSQKDLADKIDVSVSYFNDIENAKIEVTSEVYAKLAKILHITTGQLEAN